MQRRRVWMRRITKATATVAVGGLLGFLVPTVAADFSAKPQVESGTATESPVARTFIDAYVSDDQPTLERFNASADTSSRRRASRPSTRRSIRPSTSGGGSSAAGSRSTPTHHTSSMAVARTTSSPGAC